MAAPRRRERGKTNPKAIIFAPSNVSPDLLAHRAFAAGHHFPLTYGLIYATFHSCSLFLRANAGTESGFFEEFLSFADRIRRVESWQEELPRNLSTATRPQQVSIVSFLFNECILSLSRLVEDGLKQALIAYSMDRRT